MLVLNWGVALPLMALGQTVPQERELPALFGFIVKLKEISLLHVKALFLDDDLKRP